MNTIEDTLAERGKVYGSFDELAGTAQLLKGVLQDTEGWRSRLNHTHMEALELIMTKIARILNGDPNYDDNWLDIAGYATLVTKKKRPC